MCSRQRRFLFFSILSQFKQENNKLITRAAGPNSIDWPSQQFLIEQSVCVSCVNVYVGTHNALGTEWEGIFFYFCSYMKTVSAMWSWSLKYIWCTYWWRRQIGRMKMLHHTFDRLFHWLRYRMDGVGFMLQKLFTQHQNGTFLGQKLYSSTFEHLTLVFGFLWSVWVRSARLMWLMQFHTLKRYVSIQLTIDV